MAGELRVDEGDGATIVVRYPTEVLDMTEVETGGIGIG